MANRPKMSRADRAKQFAPFAALHGFEAALRKKEFTPVERAELPEDAAQELDARLRAVEKGMLVSAVFYREGRCLRRSGHVSRIDPTARILQVVDCAIRFDDLLVLELPEAKDV